MKRTIDLNAGQERILNVFAERSGRTVVELLTNFITGWIGSLEPEANRTIADAEFGRLSTEEKEKALSLFRQEGENAKEITRPNIKS